MTANEGSPQDGELSLTPARFVVAAVLVAVLALLGWIALRLLHVGPVLAFAPQLAWALVVPRAARGLPPDLDRLARRNPKLAIGWVVLVGVTFITITRLSVFMIDPSRVACAVLPHAYWQASVHSCFSAYYEGAIHVATEPDVYAAEPGSGTWPLKLGPLFVDVYRYPPPFLLLPRLLLVFTRDFFVLRAAWFLITASAIFAAVVGMARWIGGKEGIVAGLLAVFVWLSMPTLITLEMGNFHLLMISVTVLALVAMERKWYALGGALLAYVAVSKFSPALLVFFLIGRRQWRAVLWTCGFGLVELALAFFIFGHEPFEAFGRLIPKMASGTLWDLDTDETGLYGNFSVMSHVLQIRWLGVTPITVGFAKSVSNVYTIALAGAAYWAGTRTRESSRLTRATLWLSILFLSTAQAPSLPIDYAPFPALWLLTLLAARGGGSLRNAPTFVGAWLIFNIAPAEVFGLSNTAQIALCEPLHLLSYGICVLPFLRLRWPSFATGVTLGLRTTALVTGALIFAIPVYLGIYYGAWLPRWRPAPSASAPTTADQLERGRHLVVDVAQCLHCHSQSADAFGVEADPQFLGGGRAFHDGINAPNLTTDRAVGLGAWTDGEIARAIREGVDRKNRALDTKMPYGAYGALSLADTLAMVSYLRTLKPIPTSPPPSSPPWLHAVTERAHPASADEAGFQPEQPEGRGVFLLNVAGCIACHSYKETPLAVRAGDYMTGGRPFPVDGGTVYSTNLTSDMATGIGGYSDEEIVTVLTTGRARAGTRLYAMPTYRGFTEAEMSDMLLALRHVDPVSYATPRSTFER